MDAGVSNVETGTNHMSQIVLSSRLQAQLTEAYATPGVCPPKMCILKRLEVRKDDLRAYNTRHQFTQASKCQSKSLFGSIFTFRRELMKYEAAVYGMGIRQTLKMLENSSHNQSIYKDWTLPWQTSVEIFGTIITATRSKDVLAMKKAEIAKAQKIEERDRRSRTKETALQDFETRLHTQEAKALAFQSKLNRREDNLTHREHALAQGRQDLTARTLDVAQGERDVAYWEQRQAPLRNELNDRERRLARREQRITAREERMEDQENLEEQKQDVTQREKNLQRCEWRQAKRNAKLDKRENRLVAWEQDLVVREGQVGDHELDGEVTRKVKVKVD